MSKLPVLFVFFILFVPFVVAKMDIVVSYDVNTLTKEGRRRLRRVAKVCTAYGQRVQFSVFECTVSEVDFTRLKQRLLAEIEKDEDSLRIFHLPGGREKVVESFGRDHYIDFTEPLIL